MKIAIIHTTRGRPESLEQTARSWLACCPPESVKYCLGIEREEMDLYEPAFSRLVFDFPGMIKLKLFQGRRLTQEILNGPELPSEDEIKNYLTANTKGNVLAYEAATRHEDLDWIVCVADNLIAPPGWLKEMMPYFERLKNENAILGYRSQLKRRLVSHPIMSSKFYWWNNGNVMYNGYYHTHGDNELYVKGALKECLYALPDHIEPDHRHPYKNALIPEDEMNLLNNHSQVYIQGAEVFKRRLRKLLDAFPEKKCPELLELGTLAEEVKFL